MQFTKYNPPGTCKRQQRGQLVNIAQYAEREEIEPYQEGAREKRRVSFSDGIHNALPFVIPHHDYMFKLSAHRYPEQFWVEIAAYRLGCATGVPVPPAFAAYHEEIGTAGALIEWFYSYPGEPREEYIPGGDLFQRLIPDYERKKGSQHNVQDLIAIAREYEGKGLAHDWLAHWSKVLLFDVLIGNTDRHQDNWGIVKTGDNDSPQYHFCPVFDNGTALGHEIVAKKFNSVIKGLRGKNSAGPYVTNPKKAKHHLKWSREDTIQMPHFVLLQRLLKEFPLAKGYMRECLNFSPDDFRQEIIELSELSNDIPVASGILSRARAEFMAELIARRKELAQELLTN
ncbi:MAG: HipA domain-containing protein [Pseudomonadota bacterium]|nr:HipA domain-containing protein [Pseudomonadota bacterium]